jgi:aspartyl-tRNA(Asn)/glutamyl-tRNA(Gln) amidotransferase subunit B
MYQLSADDALQLSATSRMADYYEECARLSENPRSAANWIMGDLTYALKNSGKEIDDCPLPPAFLAELIQLVDGGAISGKIAKSVFEELYRTVEHPEVVVRRLGLVQISDESTIVSAIQKVKAANPRQLAEYRAGKEKLYGYFVGQVMKETKGQANPSLLNDLLERMLKE